MRVKSDYEPLHIRLQVATRKMLAMRAKKAGIPVSVYARLVLVQHLKTPLKIWGE